MGTERGERTVPAIVAALAIADVAFAFQQTAVVPAIPHIQEELGSSEAWSAWLLTGYLVIASVATPLFGKLADRHGKRRLLLISLGIFLIGSVGAGLSPSIGVLIGFRALQGCGGAVFPLTISMLRDEVPPGRVTVAVGMIIGAFGVGTALGFGSSGLIVEHLGWRWIFGVGGVLSALALVIAPLVVRRSALRTPGGLDLPGAALLTGGLSVLLVALTVGSTDGWASGDTIGCFVAFVVLMAGWAVRETHTEEPLLDLRVLAERTVLFANASTTMLGYLMFGLFLLIPYLARATFDSSPVGMGLYLLPLAIGQLIGGPFSGWLGSRREPRLILSAGMALATAATALLAAFHDQSWQVIALVFAIGIGAGISIGVVSAVVVQAVDASETGIATALNNVLRRVGGGIGGQIGSVLLVSLVLPGGGPSDTAFTVAFVITAAVAAVGTACALAIGRLRD